MSDSKVQADADTFDLSQLERELPGPPDEGYAGLLESQLTEYEMVQSMFPNPGELTVDCSVLEDFNEFIRGRTSKIPRQLDYTIHFSVDGHKIDVCVTLPLEYPAVEPDIFLRSEDLNRTQQRAINRDLSNYVSTLAGEEICILSAVSWLQEHALEYFNTDTDSQEAAEMFKKDDSFSRFWIYSHHIYSKVKCREILRLAQDCEVTGFCLPGKPGIICAEGYTSACQKWWQKVKNMSWKKITCKKVEEIPLTSTSVEKLKKFPDFRHISFEGRGNRDFKMDLGAFYKYLQMHQCECIFKDYFGVDGQ